MPSLDSPLAHLGALAALPESTGRPEMLRVLLETEKLSREVLLEHQLRRAETLLDHAARTVSLYAERLGPQLASFGPGALTIERFRELPLLSRADLRDRAAELVSRDPPPGYHRVRETKSSGSTGVPITVQIDAASSTVRGVLSVRDHSWHRRDPAQKLAVIRAEPSAPGPNGAYGAAWSHHKKSGPLAILDVSTPVQVQLDWLVRQEARYLSTYGTNAAALLTLAEKEKVRLPWLREIGTFAEVLPPGTREAAKRVWGVPLVDGYSSSEFGYIGFECREARRMHVQAESVLLEVLRDDGTPCEPGELGRVVMTALHAFYMPLIRYDIGDFAVLGEPCACGRGLSVLDRVVGRVRNLLTLANGDRFWPRFGSITLGDVAPLEQFRLVQRSFEKLELEFVAKRELTVEERSSVGRLVLGALGPLAGPGHTFELAVTRVAAIHRSAGGKFEDFVSEV